MRRNVFDRGGFDPPLPYRERKQQRTALSLVAILALTLGTAVAATVVSIGIAQAEMLVAARSDGSLAVAFLAGCIIVGAIVGAIYRYRQQHPR